ncbi:MAG: InlB B-repeat-containing protein [Chitinispirillales bacterium]|jgi:uncharacterized protein (TIGR02145 family)/uncharacterized repeat protein (TIGR02543 family)|nr:InlB B-repeat-containing protein [Chitinispirillales bacterium]
MKKGKMSVISKIWMAILAVILVMGIAGCSDDGANNGNNFSNQPTMRTLTTGVSPENSGAVSRDPHATSYQNGTKVALTATPEEGYRFIGWSDESLPATSSVVITMTGNTTITALFEPIPSDHRTLTIDIVPAVGGSVTREPNLTSYPHSTEVTVTANPAEGYTFVGWTGASESEEAEITVTMDSNMTLTANFLLNEISYYHTLTVERNLATGGTVTREPDMTNYLHGTEVTVTATAAEGYLFTGWSGASESANRIVTVTMDDNLTLTANFELISSGFHTLTLIRSPEIGGAVIPASAEFHEAGTPISIRAIPANGYRFIEWTLSDGTAQFADRSSPTTMVIINTNVIIVANFQRTYTMTINNNPTIGGTVLVDETAYTSPITRDSGTVFNISATPADEPTPGYRFVNWTATPNEAATFTDENDKNTEVILSSNATIRANFQRLFTMAIESNPTIGGTLTPESGLSHDSGTVVNISATATNIPAPGYRFHNWTVEEGTATLTNANDEDTEVILRSNATIRANFQRMFTLTIDRNLEAGGTFTPISGLSHDSGAVVNISATPASGYGFLNWTVEGGTAIFGNANNRNTTVTLSSNATIRANFAQPVLTINVNPTAGGIVTPSGQQSVAAGTPVSISATAASGYRFVNWTVVSGTAILGHANNANTTVRLSSNATIRANFVLPFNPDITYGSFTDSRDGRVYRTVAIGTQTWMAENLNWAGADGNLGQCYANNASNCDLYGRLYSWNTVMAGSSGSASSLSGVQGICPVGWHVPSDAEWTTLVNYVNTSTTSTNNAGTRLKAASPFWNGTDNHGFSALPGGARDAGGTFWDVGYGGGWWSATEGNASNAWNWDMVSNYSNVARGSHVKANLFSLRCVRTD